jgi:hypothetical protein
LRGKNFFVTKEGITTISADGLVFKKPEIQLPSIKEVGDSWMIGSKGEFIVVASDGMVYSYVEPILNRAKVLVRGGNFLVIRTREDVVHMFTLDTKKGSYYSAESAYFAQERIKLNINNIKGNGYNWLTDANGVLFVVTAQGSVLSKKEIGTFFTITNKGGHFFMDVRGGLQVVLDNGLVVLPYLPIDFGTMVKKGSNYAWNTRGDFFTFAETGAADGLSANFGTPASDRLLRSIVKFTIEQPDMRSIPEKRR